MCFTNCVAAVAVAQGSRNIVIAHPGQDIELLCSEAVTSTEQGISWLVNHTGPYGANALLNGLLPGYSTDIVTNSIIIQSITINDSRNNTEYQCESRGRPSGQRYLLYVAGECQHTRGFYA